MPEQLEKRVSMIELFYDHDHWPLYRHLSDGDRHLYQFLDVFTNRCGWLDIGFYFVDMMILLYMIGAFSAISAANFMQLFLTAGLFR